MAELTGIRNAVMELVAQQANSAQALAEQLTVIADEISQITAGQVQQADLDELATQIREAATTAEAQATQIRAHSTQIAGMIPDTPPPAP